MEESYFSAEMQSVYSAASVDWAIWREVKQHEDLEKEQGF